MKTAKKFENPPKCRQKTDSYCYGYYNLSYTRNCVFDTSITPGGEKIQGTSVYKNLMNLQVFGNLVGHHLELCYILSIETKTKEKTGK